MSALKERRLSQFVYGAVSAPSWDRTSDGRHVEAVLFR